MHREEEDKRACGPVGVDDDRVKHGGGSHLSPYGTPARKARFIEPPRTPEGPLYISRTANEVGDVPQVRRAGEDWWFCTDGGDSSEDR